MEPTKNSAHNSKSLSGCSPPSASVESLNKDGVPTYCEPSGDPLCGGKFNDSLNRVATQPDLSWLQDIPQIQKTGFGKSKTSDPMQKGHIVNQGTSRSHVYRYTRAIRGTHEAMTDMFRDVVVLDDLGKAHAVPIVWGRQERAVALILDGTDKNDGSLALDRLRLPMLAIHGDDVEFDQERFIYWKAKDYFRDKRPDGKPGFTQSEKFDRDTVFGVSAGLPINISYTLYAWTLYEEDMLQIIEQVLPKTVPLGYISVKGVQWETVVKLEGSGSNMDSEPGDQADRVLKYQWNLTAKTWLPLPIERNKAVLGIRTDVSPIVTKEQVAEIIESIETSVFKENE